MTPLLWHDDLRAAVGQARFLYHARLRGRLRTMDSAAATPATVQHNLRSLGARLGEHRGVRMKQLLAPLRAIETLGPESRCLVIGPRNESDLLLLSALGFSWSRIRGLDLISYSPRVDLGDMHAAPYPDDSFDLVVCGWTLSYSVRPEVAAAEMVRVCRPGGVIALAVEYSDVPTGRPIPGAAYALDAPGSVRINSVAQLRELFREALGEVFLAHDAPARRSHTEHALVAAPSAVLLSFANAKRS